MDFITLPLVALGLSWVIRHKIAQAFKDGREPMLWYTAMLACCIIGATQYGASSAIGVIAVSAYVYIKMSAAATGKEWKGMLQYAPNSLLPRHEDRKLLK